MKQGNVLPWSYSTLQAFETCPRRFYLTRISKQVSEPQHAASMWGNEVHKALEKAVKGEEPLPTRFKEYASIVTRVRQTPGKKLCEQKFGITASFRPTDFFAKDVWFRGVIDLNVIGTKKAATLDYKTGKIKTDGDQLKLFAAATFTHFPYLEEVTTGYLWLKDDKLTPATFTKDDIPVIWQEFLPRVNRMEQAQKNDVWMPRPSGLCREYCPVGKKLCDFCGKD